MRFTTEFELSESEHPIHFGRFSIRSCRGFGQHGQQQQQKHQINKRGSVIGIHSKRHEPSRQYSARENTSHTNTTEHGMMICFTTGSSQLTEPDDPLLPVKRLIMLLDFPVMITRAYTYLII